MAVQVSSVRAGALSKQLDLDSAADLVSREDTHVWIDADEDSPAVRAFLEQVLHLHPLAIDDIFSSAETPKFEDYGDYVYVVLHGVRADSDAVFDFDTLEIDFVWGKNWLFTHRTDRVRSILAVSEELSRNPKLLARGPGFLAHEIMDRLADFYFPVVDSIEAKVDELERAVLDNPVQALLGELFRIKRSVHSLRRLSVHQRDTLLKLSRSDAEQVPERLRPFIRDVYDEFVRVADFADNYRELLSAALSVYLSVTANKTNEIMKSLALISTLMLPLSFIAGFYGMNFESMPEFKWPYGYTMVLCIMGCTVLGFVLWFRRKRWL